MRFASAALEGIQCWVWQIIASIISFCHVLPRQKLTRCCHSPMMPLADLTMAYASCLYARADIWSTGQDAVATIKRQLQLLLYNVSIFLEHEELGIELRS